MLSDTLLDSSPSREPLLHGRHWLIVVAAGIAAFPLAYFGLPLLETPGIKVLLTQASILAAASSLSALMLAYAYADTQHLRLRSWPWMMLMLLLNVAGFLAYLVYSAAKTGNWKRATLPIAYMIEVAVVGVMIIIPLVYTQALPKTVLSIINMPATPAPRAPAAAPPQAASQQVTIEDLEKEPTVIPTTIADFKNRAVPLSTSVGVPGNLVGIVPGGQRDGVFGSLPGMTRTLPPPAPGPQAQTPFHVGGVVEAAKLIYGPKPPYPPLARMARVQGAVQLEALIARDGTIKGLKVLSGHPLLVQAALAAVQQWRYQPTLLNGQPVEVQTEIDVTFNLQD